LDIARKKRAVFLESFLQNKGQEVVSSQDFETGYGPTQPRPGGCFLRVEDPESEDLKSVGSILCFELQLPPPRHNL